MTPSDVSLPGTWPKQVKSAILHVISLAHWALIYSRSWTADSPLQRVRLKCKLDQAENENLLLREELRIKDARMAKFPSHQRPFYLPTDRLAILELRAARGWNLDQTARAFLVEPATISTWMKRIDEEGEQALVKLPAPINKFPAFVVHVVQRLKVLCPAMGKKRIAQMLARASLSISATSVARFLKQIPLPPPPSIRQRPDFAKGSTINHEPFGRVVTARYPNHIWHVDLTAIPTRAGFWVTWLPMAILQCWPFCWWVACTIDHYTRRIVDFRVFKSPPTSRQITAFLNRLIRAAGQAPKYVISDKGTQFWCKAFKHWCKRRNIQPRYGAIGKYGSIAIVERFIRSLKSECTRRLVVPLAQSAMRRELEYYAVWFNICRPHQGLGGLAPDERTLPEKKKTPSDKCWRRNSILQPMILDVSYFQERKHLPIIRLKPAA